jgi:predicted nucleic acid-binding protein
VILRALIDNSAWARLTVSAGLSARRRNEVAAAIEAGEIFTCLPFLLEAGYSARSGGEYTSILDGLLALPRVEVDPEVERHAVDAQRQLARVGHHRLPPVDVLLAAIATRHGLGILHYDADYDILARRTALEFESIWLARRGSID